MFDDHLWKYKVVLHYFRTWELKGLFLNWWKILQEHCKLKTALTSRYKLKISFPFARNCGCFAFQPFFYTIRFFDNTRPTELTLGCHQDQSHLH